MYYLPITFDFTEEVATVEAYTPIVWNYPPIEFPVTQRGDYFASNVLEGGATKDILWGGWFDDTLRGLGNDDTLNGSFGNDLLEGGDGNDELNGGDGRDTLNGGNGDDELFGGDGWDMLSGGDGSDFLDGGAGVDSVTDYGTSGNDTLRGGEGDDLVWARRGTVYGDDGNDDLGVERGTVYGGDDDDDISLSGTWAAGLGEDGNDLIQSWLSDEGVGQRFWIHSMSGGEGDDQFEIYVRDYLNIDDHLTTFITDYEEGEFVFVEGMRYEDGSRPSAQRWDSNGDGQVNIADRGTSVLNGNTLKLHGEDNTIVFEGVTSIDASDMLFF